MFDTNQRYLPHCWNLLGCMNYTSTLSYSALPLAFEGHQFLLHSSRKSPHSFTVMPLYRIDSTPNKPTCPLTDQQFSDNVTQMLNTAGTNVHYRTWSWDTSVITIYSPKTNLLFVSQASSLNNTATQRSIISLSQLPVSPSYLLYKFGFIKSWYNYI